MSDKNEDNLSKKLDSDGILKIKFLPKTIAGILNNLLKENKEVDYNPHDPFSSENISKIPLLYYIERIVKYMNIENTTLILTLIYADKVCDKSGLVIEPHNVHRILLSCTVIAIKYNEDKLFDNKFYAEVGGVSLRELNKLEFKCVEYLKYDLYVSSETFNLYVNQLNNYFSKN